MNRTIFLVLIVSFFLAGAVNADIEIVTTTPDIAAIARAIGGEKVDVISIAKGYQDPHHIIAKPSYMIKAKRADLWIRNGMDLEIGWEPLILEGARNSNILFGGKGHLDVSMRVKKLEVPQVIDRSLGDIHPLGNPHYTLDPYNGKIIAEDICNKLSEMDPDSAVYYLENLDEFVKKIDRKMFGDELVKEIGGDEAWKALEAGRLDGLLEEKNLTDKAGGWYAKMKPYHGTAYIAYHKNWSYFNRRFGLEVAEYVEPKPGIPPTPSHLMRVLQVIRKREIPFILQAIYYSTKASEFLQQKTSIKVIEAASMVGGEEGIKTYCDLFDYLTDKIAGALK